MDQGFGSQSIDKSRVLDVKPLKRLVPVFPNSPGGMSSLSNPQPMPFTCVSPTGPFPPGIQPFYPFIASTEAQQSGSRAQNGNFGSGNTVPSPVPLNSFRTPITQDNRTTRPKKRPAKNPTSGPGAMEEDGYIDSYNGNADVGSNSAKLKNRAKKMDENIVEFDFESLVNSFLMQFGLNDLDSFKRSRSEKELVETVLLVFDIIRRKLTQLEEAKHLVSGVIKQPGPKAASLLTTKGIRANTTKRVGNVPGIEVGDIYFLRMELCLVGLHAPSMAGIDYMSVKLSMDEEPVAVSIVSSGGYDDDDGGDVDVLIYTGHGGIQRKDGQMFDQKLERGNLALEKTLHRGNDVRVVRGIKDLSGVAGSKIYIYDGLYKIRESWAEKNKSGCGVFKYKLIRCPGQPNAFSLWRLIQQWKEGTAIRTGVILPDLALGSESQPVTLVNEVDGEKTPAYFEYIPSLKYAKSFSTPMPSLSCNCKGGGGCQPGNSDCPCNQKNEGLIPYSSLGILLTEKYLIHECGKACVCPKNCRNRVSQTGIKARLEVFKTRSRGWGLRSWDPIRAGTFVCEYAGDAIEANNLSNENDDDNYYIFDATRYYEPLEKVVIGDSASGFGKVPFPLVISAKDNGNVARFMNHSCSPNVFWRPVLRENNSVSYLHVAFFALRHIPPMQEIAFDYGLVQSEKGEPRKRNCLCDSRKCRGYFYC